MGALWVIEYKNFDLFILIILISGYQVTTLLPDTGTNTAIFTDTDNFPFFLCVSNSGSVRGSV